MRLRRSRNQLRGGIWDGLSRSSSDRRVDAEHNELINTHKRQTTGLDNEAVSAA